MSEGPKIVIRNGKVCWAEEVTTVKLTPLEDEELAGVETLGQLVDLLVKRGVPLTLRTPGTPVRGKAFDRFRVKTFGERVVELDAFTPEGACRQAAAKKAGRPGEVTIQRAMNQDYVTTEIKSLADLRTAVDEDEAEAREQIRRELLDEAAF